MNLKIEEKYFLPLIVVALIVGGVLGVIGSNDSSSPQRYESVIKTIPTLPLSPMSDGMCHILSEAGYSAEGICGRSGCRIQSFHRESPIGSDYVEYIFYCECPLR